MAQKSILVADDDASIRSLLRQLLTDEGYSITEAATGTEVVAQVGYFFEQIHDCQLVVRAVAHQLRVVPFAEGENKTGQK